MTPGHYSEVLEEMREHLPSLLKKAAMPGRNSKGDFTLGVSSTFRGLATVGYLVEGDVAAFRSNLVNATLWRMQLFDRFDAGDPISPSLVSMHAYKNLYDALASGDIDVASAFAGRMGGRPDAEREYDRAFEVAMGYALKAILADEDVKALRFLSDLEQACQGVEYRNFSGYAPVLRAIVARDRAAAEVAFAELLSEHRKESRGKGLFSDTEDKFLCVWGVGLLNLARSRGVAVEVVDPLIPADLPTTA